MKFEVQKKIISNMSGDFRGFEINAKPFEKVLCFLKPCHISSCDMSHKHRLFNQARNVEMADLVAEIQLQTYKLTIVSKCIPFLEPVTHHQFAGLTQFCGVF